MDVGRMILLFTSSIILGGATSFIAIKVANWRGIDSYSKRFHVLLSGISGLVVIGVFLLPGN